MIKLFITDGPHTFIRNNGFEVVLDKPIYEIHDEYEVSKNGFYKCTNCKNWFDQIITYSQYHPKAMKNVQHCAGCDKIVNNIEA